MDTVHYESGDVFVRRNRLISLDVFRGITVAGMLLVNDPGYDEIFYWPLDHAEWHGWTPTDLVFPFFLFIVGITTHLSFANRRTAGNSTAALYGRLLRRAGLIFLIGLVLNWFPFYSITMANGAPDADLLSRMADRLLRLRIPGVLQRIAVCYLFGGLIALKLEWRTQIALLAAILIGYWLILMAIPVPDTGAIGSEAIAEPSATLAAWIDRGLFDWGGWGNHLWRLSKTWDPEGALSTLPAIGTMISGLLAGQWICRKTPIETRTMALVAAGLAAFALGLAWAEVLPINKKLWTSSYVLLSSGLGAVLLGLLMKVIDIGGRRRWADPFLVFGVNPILAYAMSHIFAVVVYAMWTVSRDGQRVGVERWFTDVMFATWMPEKMASLAFAIFFVTCCYGFLRFFYKRGIILKV